jgi:hypothetical protein
MASSSYYLNHNPERRKRNPRRLLAAVSLTLHQPLEEYLQRASASGLDAHHVVEGLHERLTRSLALGEVSSQRQSAVAQLCTALQRHRQAALELVTACAQKAR